MTLCTPLEPLLEHSNDYLSTIANTYITKTGDFWLDRFNVIEDRIVVRLQIFAIAFFTTLLTIILVVPEAFILNIAIIFSDNQSYNWETVLEINELFFAIVFCWTAAPIVALVAAEYIYGDCDVQNKILTNSRKLFDLIGM
jgi:hypothetical protein